MFNINTFRSELKYGGARTSLFQVTMTNPIDTSADSKLPFMCKMASLPASTITPIETHYFGRPIKLSGNRTFEDLNLTIINDEDFKVRNALEAWSNSINALERNIRTLPSSQTSLYKSTAEVQQLGQNGDILRTYKFVGVWPTTIAQIDLDWSNEAVQEFQCTFAVDYWYVSKSNTGDGGGR